MAITTGTANAITISNTKSYCHSLIDTYNTFAGY